MVAEPAAIAFTRPLPDTVAMLGAFDVQLVLRAPVVPSESVATAVSRSESPSISAAVAGVTATEVTVTAGDTGGLVDVASPPPPQAARTDVLRTQSTSDRDTRAPTGEIQRPHISIFWRVREIRHRW
jgi:hypothetical protein